jgi:hypothetical protein
MDQMLIIAWEGKEAVKRPPCTLAVPPTALPFSVAVDATGQSDAEGATS